MLLVALTVFVFAQAAVTRSGGQSAADAAALAATREARDALYDDFLDFTGDEDDEGDLEDIVAGEDFGVGSACAEAVRLAAANGADVEACDPDRENRGYTVTVETRDTVGASVIPGTEDMTASATATAVLDGRCEVTGEEDDLIELRCGDGEEWSFDPGDEDDMPEARDLFDVYLDD